MSRQAKIIIFGVILAYSLYSHQNDSSIFDWATETRENSNKKNFNKETDKLTRESALIDDFTNAIELDPYDELAYLGRGDSKISLKDYYGAIEDYTKAIELDPNFVKAFYGRGKAKHNSKDFSGAIEDYNKAIDIESDYSAIYNSRGDSKISLKDYYGAIEDYNRFIGSNTSDETTAYLNRGFARENIGDLDGACKDWNYIKKWNKVAEKYVLDKCDIKDKNEFFSGDKKIELPIFFFQPKNGFSPYNAYFGKGIYDNSSGNVFILKNSNDTDAVVLLVNAYSGKKVRNEYVRKGASFEMTGVPNGTYYLEWASGTNWSPELKVGRLTGGFQSKATFTKTRDRNDWMSVDGYKQWTVTLYSVTGGDVESENLSANEFGN
ncbi:tetratricopeptide repeat protein [Flavobacteriaceae bacterium]|nr:tetratricopeptide repeat protein [Flavobacteriaceae bacterium]